MALSGQKAMEAVHALTSQGGGDRPCGGLDEPIYNLFQPTL